MNILLHTVPYLLGTSLLLSACENATKRQVGDFRFMASLTQTHSMVEQEARRPVSDCDTINESPACGTI